MLLNVGTLLSNLRAVKVRVPGTQEEVTKYLCLAHDLVSQVHQRQSASQGGAEAAPLERSPSADASDATQVRT